MSKKTNGEVTSDRRGHNAAKNAGEVGFQAHRIEEPDQTSLVPVEDKFTKRYSNMDEKIDMLKSELETQILSLDTDKKWLKAMDSMRQFHQYSFGNQLLILLQNPEATQCAGYNTWKKLDRQVKKGERGISILAPKTVSFTAKDENDNPVMGDDGKPLRVRRMVGFVGSTTFDVSQTEGEPLFTGKEELSESPPPGYVEKLTGLVEAHGYTVSYQHLMGSTGGFTSPYEKRVVVNSAFDAANQAKTLAHELGHIEMGHADRLDEYHTGGSGCRGEMEVEAESFAYIVSRENGMSVKISQNSSRYLNSWAAQGHVDEDGREKTVKALRSSGENIRQAVKRVLS